MILQRLKQIEKDLKEKFKPEQVEYIRLDNNKMIVIGPGDKGVLIKFEYAMGLTEKLIIKDFSIEEIKKLYPGFELIDITKEMDKLANTNFLE